MPTAAILFDLDGTLVDTELLWEEAVIESLKTASIELSSERFRSLYGTGLRIKDLIVKCGGNPASEQSVRRVRDDLYHKLLRTKAVWKDGAQTMLKTLREKMPIAIITGSYQSYLDALPIRLAEHVETIITANDVGDLMKPHPHGLLLAATQLNVEPEECIYVGDQWFDMQAARNAGMNGVLIANEYTTPEAYPLADKVIEQLSDVMKFLE